jgi:hypothetical protein
MWDFGTLWVCGVGKCLPLLKCEEGGSKCPTFKSWGGGKTMFFSLLYIWNPNNKMKKKSKLTSKKMIFGFYAYMYINNFKPQDLLKIYYFY